MYKKFTICLTAILLILLIASSCSNSNSPETVVRRVLDCTLDNSCLVPVDLSVTDYIKADVDVYTALLELEDYDFVAYEIKNVSGNSVSVEVHYNRPSSIGRLYLAETWRFVVEDGEIAHIYN